ncbi:MAG TPA: hypothetical protein VFX59_28650 [Polyangiales bacterium]|nr:hypothetical protein [Polyangiales bacterium]
MSLGTRSRVELELALGNAKWMDAKPAHVAGELSVLDELEGLAFLPRDVEVGTLGALQARDLHRTRGGRHQEYDMPCAQSDLTPEATHGVLEGRIIGRRCSAHVNEQVSETRFGEAREKLRDLAVDVCEVRIALAGTAQHHRVRSMQSAEQKVRRRVEQLRPLLRLHSL